MINIAAHVRIFDPNPNDDLVTKRTSAIKDISARYSKARPVLDIFKSANDLAQAVDAKGSLSETLTKEVVAAVSKTATAFIADGQNLQITVCGLLGALQSLDGAKPSTGNLMTHDVFSVGLWLALSFQAPRKEPKLESLRVELLQKAQEFTLLTAAGARQRIPVPDVTFAAPAQFDAPSVGESFTAGAKATINALRANAIVDREEIDLLWWILADWSKLLDRRFSGSDTVAAVAVASGLEAGGMLRGMPAHAHHHLVLRHVGKMAPISLPELLASIGDDRERLIAPYVDNSIVTAFPAIFPMLAALRSGSAADAQAKIKRPLEEWAARALLESAACHVTAHLPRVTV